MVATNQTKMIQTFSGTAKRNLSGTGTQAALTFNSLEWFRPDVRRRANVKVVNCVRCRLRSSVALTGTSY